MSINEIALKVAEETGLRLDNACGCPSCRQRDDPPRITKFAHALIAELAKQVPDFRGYAELGTGQYLLNACPATDTLPAELVISVATEEEKIGRVIGDLKDVDPGPEIAPDKMAVRLAFFSVAGLDALEQQLRILRYESFPESAPIPPAVPEGWISVVDRLPKPYEQVMVWPHPSEQSMTAYYGLNKTLSVDPIWIYSDYEMGQGWFDYECKPTHWMPLPAEPTPKEES